MSFLKRDSTIDRLKGIGIILMVVGHAGCPQIIHDYIYTFHMPLFFIASGYFFNEKSISNKMHFLIKKVKGIYLPFITCSLAFLLIHNVLFKIGVINGSYGSIDGTVSYLYSCKEIISRSFHIVFQMNQYESFLLGAFWFLRALFLSSLLLCFGTWLCSLVFKKIEISVIIFSLLSLLGAGFIKYTHFSIPYAPSDGYRELIGAFFMGAGFVIRKHIEYISSHRAFLIFAILVSVVLFIFHPASIELNSGLLDWAIIPFSGITGTYILYYTSKKWNSLFGEGRIIAFIGRKSIWILTLHLLVFKLSGLVEIWIYDLPIQMIGSHTVIPPLDNWFFIIHTFFAVSIPLFLAAWCYCCRRGTCACQPPSASSWQDTRDSVS